MLLQVRQNKRQLSLDLDIGVCLKAREIRAFNLLNYFTRLLTPPSVLHSPGLDFASQQGGCCWPGRVRQKIASVSIVQLLVVTSLGHLRSRSLGIPQHLSPPTSFISSIFPHFQGLSSGQDLHLLPLHLLFSLPDHFCFLGTLLFGTTSSFCDPYLLLFLI